MRDQATTTTTTTTTTTRITITTATGTRAGARQQRHGNTGKQTRRFKRKGSMDARLKNQVRGLKKRVPGRAGVKKRGSGTAGVKKRRRGG